MRGTATIAPRIEVRHWRLAVIAGMASYLDSALIVSTGLALAIWQRHYGLDTLTLGMISGTLTLGIAVGALFGGRIADVFGRRRVFNIDVFLYVIGVVLIAVAPNTAWITAGVAVAGLAAGADLPTSVAVVADLAPRGTQGRLVAFTQVMWSVGIGAATGLGFAVSTMGVTGTRLLFVHLAVIGSATWLVRVFSPTFRRLEDEAERANTGAEAAREALPLRVLFTTPSLVRATALTCLFYVAWNLMANTLGQFKAFFLVTVSGATQTTATALIFPTVLLSVIGGLLFVKIADTKLRRPMFYVGAALQIIGMAVAALTGGTSFVAMAVCLALYSLFYPFAGEALYKVWTQESFPANARATVQGVTYSVSRFLCAGFALVTPAIVNQNPTALLWILVACATASALVGSVLIRRQPGIEDIASVPTAHVTGPANV